jgi:hypothetical protein
MVMPELLYTFRHEVVSTILVSLFVGSVTMPFRKIMQAYRETKSKLDSISTELTEQRTNCLATLSRQGDKQIELLGKAVEVLGEMHTDSKLMLEHLRDERKG